MQMVRPYAEAYHTNRIAMALLATLMAGLVAVPAVGIVQRPRKLHDRPKKLHVKKSKGANHTAVFIAGIEGTLHHFWYDVFQACVKMKRCGFPDGELQSALWNNRDNQAELDREWKRFMNSNWLMKKKATLYVNWAKNSMLSYPNINHYAFPELGHYAKAAKAANSELRVILMLRDGYDVLFSAQKRFKHHEKELVKAAGILKDQLRQYKKVFPHLLTCVETDDVPLLANELNEFFINAATGEHFLNMSQAMKDYYENKRMSVCREEGCRKGGMKTAMDAIRKECHSIVKPIGKKRRVRKTKKHNIVSIFN